jgi:putative glutamine amidotransferase
MAIEIRLSSTPAEIAHLGTLCQGVLLPGSPADVNPQKYGQERIETTAAPDLGRENVDELLLQDAHNLSKPIFGVCYGLQFLNMWRGGTLVQDLAPLPVNHSAGPAVSVAHGVKVYRGSIIGSTLAPDASVTNDGLMPATVNSSHHQAIGVLGDNLRVTARCTEDGVIEAVESGSYASASNTHFVVGVQWHPERSYDHDSGSRALFTRFIAEAAVWQPRVVSASVV